MFKQTTPSSLVTLILPPPVMRQITAESFLDDFGTALLHRARGSLLQENWLKKWLPPVSPAKSMLQLMVQPGEVDSLVSRIVKQSNLDQQAVGAVFSSDSDQVHFGPEFRRQATNNDASASPTLLREKLHAIYCIVSHKQSDRVCKAAIDAGAHGPIVHYSEGRGLKIV